MTTIKIESKIFRQLVKGLAFYEGQMNHSPTMEELKSFVLLEDKYLAQISRKLR